MKLLALACASVPLVAALGCDSGAHSAATASTTGSSGAGAGSTASASATTSAATTSSTAATTSSTAASGGMGGGPTTWSCLEPYKTPPVRDPGLWPFASNSPWNTPIGSGATFESATGPKTTDLMGSGSAPWINSHQWSHPVYFGLPTDPAVTLEDNGMSVDTGVRCPANATPALPPPPNTDAHLHIIDPTHAFVDEMWEASKISVGWDSKAWAKNMLNGLGVGQGGVRAYGGSAIGGLIRVGELGSEIRHALAFCIQVSLQTDMWVWPATTNDHWASSMYTGHLPMGQLVAIPPDVDLCSLGLSAAGLVVARALQDFGAYLVDSGGGLSFYAEPRVEDDASVGETALLTAARDDLAKLGKELRVVTNNGASTPGGGGTPRAPAPPTIP